MGISQYSSLTHEALDAIHKELTAKYGGDLHNENLPQDERKLETLVKKQVAEDKRDQEIAAVQDFVKEYLYRNLRELALIIYLIIDKRQDFGVHGEDNVSTSFGRNILNIPRDHKLLPSDHFDFLEILKTCDRRKGKKSADAYLDYVKNYELELFGKKYPCHNFEDINVILDLLNSDSYLYCTQNASFEIRYIFGSLEKKALNGESVFLMKKEYVRSPQFVLAIAANVYNKSMLIRQEACESIFYNRWLHNDEVLETRLKALGHTNDEINKGLKTKTMEAYSVAKTEDILKIKDIYIEEMIDGIFWHELGHHIAYSGMDPLHYAFRNNFSADETVGHALIEALADWAPTQDRRMGAFNRFLEIAREDKNKAKRVIYAYMRDNWFVSGEKEIMGLISDTLVSLAMYCINPDGSMDFTRMEQDKDRIYELLQNRYTILVERLRAVLQTATYETDNGQRDYKAMEKEIYELFQNTHNACPQEELPLASSFWLKIVEYLKKYSKTGWEQYEGVLNEEADLLKQAILREIIQDREEKYNRSLREYIIARARETGIIKTPPTSVYIDLGVPKPTRRKPRT